MPFEQAPIPSQPSFKMISINFLGSLSLWMLSISLFCVYDNTLKKIENQGPFWIPNFY